MSTNTEKLLRQALTLTPSERAEMAEGLLTSLDRPDPEIDQLWAREAEDRIDAAEGGAMKIIPEEDVFGKYEDR